MPPKPTVLPAMTGRSSALCGHAMHKSSPIRMVLTHPRPSVDADNVTVTG